MIESAGTVTPGWAIQIWEGPTFSRALERVWSTARDGVRGLIRPLVRETALAELFELLDAGSAFEQGLRAHATSEYDRRVVDDLIGDSALGELQARLNRAAHAIIQKHPEMFRRGRRPRIFPRRVLRDPAVRARVEGALDVWLETIAVLPRIREREAAGDPEIRGIVSAEMSPEERAITPCWWVYDSGIPREIARRLTAGRRSDFILGMARTSRRIWTTDSLRRAALDWADEYEDGVGFIASLPGVSIRSLPDRARMSLRDVLEQHEMTQVRFRAAAVRAKSEEQPR